MDGPDAAPGVGASFRNLASWRNLASVSSSVDRSDRSSAGALSQRVRIQAPTLQSFKAAPDSSDAPDGARRTLSIASIASASVLTMRRKKKQTSRVLNAAVDAEDFEDFWQESLALTTPDPVPETPPPPPPKPPSPPSSDLGDELSDEEDEQLAALLTSMPHLNAQLNPAILATAGLQPTPPPDLHRPDSRQAGSSARSSLPGTVLTPSQPSTPPPQSTGVSSTLLRLARLNKQMAASAQEGSMVSAMFEAARQGAESLDAHGPLRSAAAQSRPMTALLPWNKTTNSASVARREELLRASAPCGLPGKSGAVQAAPSHAQPPANAKRPDTAPTGRGAPVSVNTTAPGRLNKPAAGVNPRPAAPDSVNVSVHGQHITLDTKDPFCEANAHMTCDMVASSKKLATAEAEKANPLKPHQQGMTKGKAGKPGSASPAARKAASGPAFLSSTPTSTDAALVKEGGGGGANTGASQPASDAPQKKQAKPKTPPSIPTPAPPRRKTTAELEQEAMERKFMLAEAKHAAVQSALLGQSPLRAKLARPVSALMAASTPASGSLSADAFEAVPLSAYSNLRSSSRPNTAPGMAYPDRLTAPNTIDEDEEECNEQALVQGLCAQDSDACTQAGGYRSVDKLVAEQVALASDQQVLGHLFKRPTSAAVASRAMTARAMRQTATFNSRPGSPSLGPHTSDAGLSSSHDDTSSEVFDEEQQQGDGGEAAYQVPSSWAAASAAAPPAGTRPPSRGAPARKSLIKSTRAAREMDMLILEEANMRSSGPMDAVGEVGRLIRRYHMQMTGTLPVFNLSHSMRSISQVEALVEALPQLPQLSALALADNDLNDKAMSLLSAALTLPCCNQLDAMDLSANKLSITSMKVLCPLMLDPVVLGRTESSSGRQSRSASTEAAHKALPASLTRSPDCQGAVLKELLLAGNTFLGDASAELLAVVIVQPACALRVLDLGKCAITERGASALGEGIAKCKCLEVLDLSWNALGVRGTAAFSKGLHSCACLISLHMAWTGAGDTGASHVVQALQHNTKLQVLDLSGNSVSADTCMVLQETLKVNTTLTTLVLRDNPLGQVGARRLLRAVHDLAGSLDTLDLMGCTFQGVTALPGGGSITPVPTYNANQPDGEYCLDLSVPANLQVAYELLALAQQQGTKTWKNATLDGRPFKLQGFDRKQLPKQGTLKLEFFSTVPLAVHDTPMTDMEFQYVWMNQVYEQDKKAAQQGREGLGPRAFGKSARPSSTPSGLAPTAASGDPLDQLLPPDQCAADPVPQPIPLPMLDDIETDQSPDRAGLPRTRTASLPGSVVSDSNSSGSRARQGRGSSTGMWPVLRGLVGGGASESGSLLLADRGLSSAGANTSHSHINGITDSWKLSLLGALTSESFLKCSQLVQVVDALQDSTCKTQAAVQCFGKLSDPENLQVVFDALSPQGAAVLKERVGDLVCFHQRNPTGSWHLPLSHSVAAGVAQRLITAASQQHDMGLCRWPFHTCLVQCSVDGHALDTQDPHKIVLPREGMLKINFVDLRPIPAGAKPFTNQQLAVLISMLTKQEKLNPKKVVTAIDAASVNTVVDVLSKWGAAAAHSSSVSAGGVAVGLSSHVASLRAAASRHGVALMVHDLQGLIPTIRLLSLNHFIQCDQLIELLSLLPYHNSVDRVEVASIFWARCIDRATKWTDVMRCLSEAQQVMLAQRLGYCNIFNAKRPSLHYRLRMFRPDEHEIAWQLFNMALDSPLECFTNVFIDGEPKKINEGSSIWPVLRGSAQDGTVPTCTIEFDFTWPEEGKTEDKVIDTLRAHLEKAKENLKPGSSAGGTSKSTGKLLAVALRSGSDKPSQPRSSSARGPSPRDKQPALKPSERDAAEGVPLDADGRLQRIAPQASMTHFVRTSTGQAAQTAARALYLDNKAKEEVGMFGYHISHGGGLMLDKRTRDKLRAPIEAIAQGQAPGGLDMLPWDASAPVLVQDSARSHVLGAADSGEGSPQRGGLAGWSRLRQGTAGAPSGASLVSRDRYAEAGGSGDSVLGSVRSEGGRESVSGASRKVSVPGAHGGVGSTGALLQQMAHMQTAGGSREGNTARAQQQYQAALESTWADGGGDDDDHTDHYD